MICRHGLERETDILSRKAYWSSTASTANGPRASLSASQRFALDKLHHEELAAAGLLESVQDRDVRGVQRRKDVCFTLETVHAIRIAGELFRRNFDRDGPARPHVRRRIHFSHSADADESNDFIDAQPRAGREGTHEGLRGILSRNLRPYCATVLWSRTTGIWFPARRTEHCTGVSESWSRDFSS